MARPRQVSDDAILNAARETFLNEGPSASVRRIAEQVGVSQAALFKRFGSKHKLMLAALVPAPPLALIAALDDGPTDDAIPDQLLGHAMMAHQHLQKAVPQLWALKASRIPLEVLHERFDELPAALLRRAMVAWFRRAEEAGQIRHGDPVALTTMLMGSLHGRAMIAHMEGVPIDSATAESWLRQVVDTLWRGISASETA